MLKDFAQARSNGAIKLKGDENGLLSLRDTRSYAIPALTGALWRLLVSTVVIDNADLLRSANVLPDRTEESELSAVFFILN